MTKPRNREEYELLGANDEWYHHLFGGVHTAGKLIASAFPGGAQLAAAAEKLEDPILPDWAKAQPSASPSAATAAPATGRSALVISKPDTVAVLKGGKLETIPDAAEVAVVGGTRSSSGRTYTFTAPERVAVKLKSGKINMIDSPEQVIFMGGSEAQTRVAGVDDMIDYEILGKQIVGEAGWTEIYGSPFDSDLLRTKAWEATPSYIRGDRVTHNGVEYVATRDTRGETPGTLTDAWSLAALWGASGGLSASPPSPKLLELLGTGVTEAPDESVPEEVTEDDYIYGTMCLGAAADVASRMRAQMKLPQRAGFVLKKTPTGRVFTSLSTTKAAPKTGRASVANARDVGKRAQQVGKSLLSALSSGKIRIRGADDAYAVLGVAPLRKKSPARPRMTVPQMKAAAEALVRAGKDLEQRAGKHEKLVEKREAQQKLDSQKRLETTKARFAAKTAAPAAARLALTPAASRATIAPRAVTRTASVLGDTDNYEIISGPNYEPKYQQLDVADVAYQIIGRDEMSWTDIIGHDQMNWTEILGSVAADLTADILGQQQSEYPGWLADGSPDPTYTDEERAGLTPPPNAGGTGGGAAGTGDTGYYGSGESYAPPGPPDYGLEPAPTGPPPLVEGKDYIKDPYPNQAVDDPNEYDSTKRPLPVGAIYYENQKGRPFRFIASKTYYTGDAPADSGKTSGFVWWTDHFGFVDWKQTGDKIRNVPPGSGLDNIAAISRNSLARGWGPIVGNPADTDFKNARMDVGTGKLFWFRDTAPQWATAADDIERYNKAVLDWKTEWTRRKTDYDQWVIQDRLEKEEADRIAKEQAKLDEEMARRQERERQEAAHQGQIEEQRLAQEVERFAQEQERGYSQLDMDERRAMLEQMKQGAFPMWYAEEGGEPLAEGEEGVDWGSGEREGLYVDRDSAVPEESLFEEASLYEEPAREALLEEGV